MGIKQIRPINSASRFQSFPTFEEITAERPLKGLTRGKSKTGGRNNRGQLTSWFRGGGLCSGMDLCAPQVATRGSP